MAKTPTPGSGGKRGRPPSHDPSIIPNRYEAGGIRSNFHEFLRPEDRDDLREEFREFLRLKPADADIWNYLMGITTAHSSPVPREQLPALRNELREELRFCLDEGVVTEDDLQGSQALINLLGEVGIVDIDNKRARIVQCGPISSKPDGSPDLSKHRVIITSKRDGGIQVCLKTYITGEVLPYLAVNIGCLADCPALRSYIKLKGILAEKTSGIVNLQRIVLAVGGHNVRGMHAHHEGPTPELFGGFGTLDCRAAVLESKPVSVHEQEHWLKGDKRFYTGVE